MPELQGEFILETDSEEETIAAGVTLGRILPVGSIIGLTGVLGAGKTTFTKGIIHGILGTSLKEVDSPTFTLVHEYRSEPAQGKQKTVYHIDLYRIKEDSPIFATDILMLQEYIERSDSIVIVEWADKFLNQLAESWLQIDILQRAANGEQKRALHFHISGDTPHYLPILKEMQQQCLH